MYLCFSQFMSKLSFFERRMKMCFQMNGVFITMTCKKLVKNEVRINLWMAISEVEASFVLGN